MQIEISKDTLRHVEKISLELGIKEQQVIDRAVSLYLDTISKYLSLKQEMKEWDFLSDEALSNFEKTL